MESTAIELIGRISKQWGRTKVSEPYLLLLLQVIFGVASECILPASEEVLRNLIPAIWYPEVLKYLGKSAKSNIDIPCLKIFPHLCALWPTEFTPQVHLTVMTGYLSCGIADKRLLRILINSMVHKLPDDLSTLLKIISLVSFTRGEWDETAKKLVFERLTKCLQFSDMEKGTHSLLQADSLISASDMELLVGPMKRILPFELSSLFMNDNKTQLNEPVLERMLYAVYNASSVQLRNIMHEWNTHNGPEASLQVSEQCQVKSENFLQCTYTRRIPISLFKACVRRVEDLTTSQGLGFHDADMLCQILEFVKIPTTHSMLSLERERMVYSGDDCKAEGEDMNSAYPILLRKAIEHIRFYTSDQLGRLTPTLDKIIDTVLTSGILLCRRPTTKDVTKSQSTEVTKLNLLSSSLINEDAKFAMEVNSFVLAVTAIIIDFPSNIDIAQHAVCFLRALITGATIGTRHAQAIVTSVGRILPHVHRYVAYMSAKHVIQCLDVIILASELPTNSDESMFWSPV